MKLRQPSEPRASRPKAREVMGTGEQAGLLVFDPRRDIPEWSREKYKRQLCLGTGIVITPRAAHLGQKMPLPDRLSA